MGRMVSKAKDSIGSKLSEREGLNEPDALALVGFQPVDQADRVLAGAHLMTAGAEANAANDQGYITSACYSPNLGSSIGIGFLKNGAERKGEVVRAVSPLTGLNVDLKVVSAHFVDPEGDRLRA
jgi:sarcosine oxidase subunit alpha